LVSSLYVGMGGEESNLQLILCSKNQDY